MNKKNEEKSFSKVRLNWYPGHMAKTKRQMIEDLKIVDVVVEILDARIPKSSRNMDLEQYSKDKKRVIALNKSDLAEEMQNQKWVEYYKQKGIPAILTDSNSGKGINDVLKAIEKVAQENQEVFAKKGRTGKAIRVMIIGIPNVGKSSFINRVAKRNSAMVGNRPGVTRQKQWIKIKENIELLDTPGILWPKLEPEEVALNLAFTGTIKDDILEKVEVAYFLLKYLIEHKQDRICERYHFKPEEIEEILKNDTRLENENIFEIMCQIGKKRGAIIAGGKVDEEKVANILLEDFRSGKLGKITIETI